MSTSEIYKDYHTGGSPMPGRNFNSNSYRYGYNKGSEKDDEISGAGNHFTTFYREGDTRLLTWWSPDPKASEQPWQSPYSYMDGNPIAKNDPNGDCPTCISGAISGAATEIIAQFAVRYFIEGNDAKTALMKTDWTDVLVSAGTGALSGAIDGGASKWASFLAKPQNREAMEIMIKEGGELLIEGLNNVLQDVMNDKDIDITETFYETLKNYGIGKVYESKVKKADLGSGNKKVEMKKAEDRASRKSASASDKTKFSKKADDAKKSFIKKDATEKVIDKAAPAAAGKATDVKED